jgi:phage gp46-like protein
MPDIRIVQNTDFPETGYRDARAGHYSVTTDWSLLLDGTLDETQALATAVVVALGTDSLASPADILPDPDSTERMGWWGNLDAQEIWGGWDIGCKLWLLKRSKIVGPEALEGATVTRVKQYISDAIQPFIDRRIGSSFEVEAERVGKEQINAIVRIYRGPRLEIDLRYQILWEGMFDQGGGYNIGRAPFPPEGAEPPRPGWW